MRRRSTTEATEAVRAAIYCRISKDASGQSLGVERQEADCRELAERMGWEVVAVYVDNDISASTRSRKPRPQYDEMLRAVKGGQIDAVLVYSNSRLTRRPKEWMTWIELAGTGRLRIKTVASGEHDLGTADGRATAITIAAWDAAEAERTGERVSRAKDQAAAGGRYRGGVRPYRFEADGVTVRKREAKVIRDMTQAVLAGRSLRSLTRELNERGHTTSTGKPWTYQRLRDVLMRPRNAGLISSGRPTRNDFEILGEAVWPAIVDEDTWRALHAMLAHPSRRVHGNTEARWIGSLTYRCGRCGATMRATSMSGRTSRYHYVCREKEPPVD